jgi:GNAT superfamily N-acetyltransferase
VLTAAPTRCVTVATRSELRDWIGLTDRIYANDPCFIPPLRQQLADFYEQNAPYVRYGGIEFLSAVRDGEVVGRTTAHTNTKLDAKLGERQLLFGFTEFVDEDAFAALVDALEQRAREAGAVALFGPANLLPNQSGGVVISGFGQRGFIDSPYNPPYYPPAYEAQGFERMFEGATFICPLGEIDAPVEQLFPFPEERVAAERLEVRQADRRKLEEEIDFVRAMLNASFAQLGYYTEIDADELAYQVDGLSHLIDERIALYLFKGEKPIAFILCIPDISEFVHEIGGNLGLVNQVRLLLRRSRYRQDAVAVIKGTVPEEQGKGYMRLLSRELLRNLRAAGYETLRGTFIEEENVASSSQVDHMGGRPLHGVTFYRRAVAA